MTKVGWRMKMDDERRMEDEVGGLEWRMDDKSGIE
jgi:hypothetical protein